MTDKPLLRAVGQDPPPDPFDLDNLRLSQNFKSARTISRNPPTMESRQSAQALDHRMIEACDKTIAER